MLLAPRRAVQSGRNTDEKKGASHSPLPKSLHRSSGGSSKEVRRRSGRRGEKTRSVNACEFLIASCKFLSGGFMEGKAGRRGRKGREENNRSKKDMERQGKEENSRAKYERQGERENRRKERVNYVNISLIITLATLRKLLDYRYFRYCLITSSLPLKTASRLKILSSTWTQAFAKNS